MDCIQQMFDYIDDETLLDRKDLRTLLSGIDQEIGMLAHSHDREMLAMHGQVRRCEQELRVIRKVANRYFKNESDALQDDLPY